MKREKASMVRKDERKGVCCKCPLGRGDWMTDNSHVETRQQSPDRWGLRGVLDRPEIVLCPRVKTVKPNKAKLGRGGRKPVGRVSGVGTVGNRVIPCGGTSDGV